MKKIAFFLSLLSLNILGQNTFKEKEAKVLNKNETPDYVEISRPIIYKEQNAAIYGKTSNIKANSPFELLEKTKSSLNIKNPTQEFKIISENTQTNGIKHIRVQQSFNNIEIYGAESILHSNISGNFETLNGRVFPTPAINNKPKLDSKRVLELIYNKLNLDLVKNNEKSAAQIYIKYYDNLPKLIYFVKIKPNLIDRWCCFVDANTGEMLEKYNETCTLDGNTPIVAKDLNGVDQKINTTKSGNKYFLIDATKQMYNTQQSSLPDNPNGTIWTIDGMNSRTNSTAMNFGQLSSIDNTWSPNAVSAHSNASICYDYYLKTFGRNSLNGAGANIISVINIADKNGESLDNAYWNGEFMGYGNGSVKFKPLAGALDIAGHEMTHGIIENTAKLEYRNQSGAISESMADVFGAFIEGKNWTIGEDVVKTSAYPSGALRSLENPNQNGILDPGYQPKKMSQFQYLQETESQDNGGVHINSGIPNYAFYKFVTSENVGKSKAEKVYYSVLTNYLTRTSTFLDLRYAVVNATKDFYGDGLEAKAAKAAFDAAEIYDPNESSGNSTTIDTTGIVLTPNPGVQNVVSFDMRANDQSIYTLPYENPSNDKLVNLSNGIGCLGKPSITDDGNFLFFVANDNNIYKLDLINRTSPEKITSDSTWRNVAISKNGKIIAALKKHDMNGKIIFNNNIYVTNLETKETKAVPLYNPTYSTGISTGEVLYADSFEWDYSSENIIYDAFNQVKGSDGTQKINYWDVGIIHVFDGISKKIKDSAVVQKVFTNLKNGENIGNPSISKTNTNIIAFDYYNPTLPADHQFKLLIVDFNKSNSVDTLSNNIIGYPNFSKLDDVLFYNSYDNVNKKNVVIVYGLKSNSQVGIKQKRELYSDAKWATPYSMGKRSLPTKTTQYIEISTQINSNNPNIIKILGTATSKLPLIYTLISGDAALDGNILTLGTKPGKVIVRAIQLGNAVYNSTSSDFAICIFPKAPVLKDSLDYVIASGGTLIQFYLNTVALGSPTQNLVLKKSNSGTYSAKSLTSDGCPSGFSNSLVYNALAIDNFENDQAKVFPNPFNEGFKLEINPDEILKSTKMLNATGKTIVDSIPANYNFTNLPTGTYFLQIETNKNIYTKKIIKD